MNPERLLALATARGVDLEGMSRGGEPDWTAEDVALAAAGLPTREFQAALFTLAGDDSVRGAIRRWLLAELEAEQSRREWARAVERTYGDRSEFGPELVDLFLAEERRPWIMQAVPLLRAIWMQVEQPTWTRTLSHQYAFVQSEFARARLDAEEHVRRRLRES